MQDKSQLDLIISLFSNGKVQEALDQIDPLIKDNPNDAVLFNIRGACYAHIGEPIMAMKQYERAIEMDSNYSEAYNNLGITYQGAWMSPEKALANFEKAFSLKPDKVEIIRTS
jgi:Flp pilus assembly protein TadD